jgi:hypothetical protein
LQRGGENERLEAAIRLSAKGKSALNAIPVLLGALEDESIRIRIGAAAAIASITRDPVDPKYFAEKHVLHVVYGAEPTLRDIVELPSCDERLRAVAAGVLAHIDAKNNGWVLHEHGVPALQTLLAVTDEADAVSVMRLYPLGLISPEQQLTPATRVRAFAVTALGAMGKMAQAALPALRAIRDNDSVHPELRRVASRAVECIETADE